MIFFIYWFLFFLSSMALLDCLAAAATIGWRYSLAAQDRFQNRRVYALPGLRYLWWLPVYELLAVPILFGKGVFQRTIHWRGRRYRLGRHGMIQEVREQEGGSS